MGRKISELKLSIKLNKDNLEIGESSYVVNNFNKCNNDISIK